MLRQYILIILLFSVFRIYADVAPKHSESINIKFQRNNIDAQVDSLYILVTDGSHIDTALLPPHTTAQYWTRPTLKKHENQYELFTHGSIKSFKIVAFLDQKVILSDFIANYPGNLIYNIDIQTIKLENKTTEITLTDKSTLFHQNWPDYLKALITTILIELILGLYYYYKYKNGQSLILFISFLILTNLLTHFSLWYIYSHNDIPMFFLELCVIIAETLFWKLFFRISFKSSFLISLILNLLSWLIGVIV